MGHTEHAITDIAVVCGTLSTLGSLAVICSSLLIPNLRAQLNRGRVLIVMLGLADLGQGIYFMLTSSYDLNTGSDSCFGMALFGIITSVQSYILTAWIAWWVHYIIINPESPPRVATVTLFPLLAAVLYPAVSIGSMIGWSYHKWKGDWRNIMTQSQDFPWCFVADQPAAAMFGWRMAVEYVPLISSMVLTAYFYMSAVRHLKKQAQMVCLQESPEIGSMTRKFLLIASVFLAIRSPGMFARLLTMATGDNSVWVWLRILTVLGDPSQGFANGLIFTFGTRIVREKIKECVLAHLFVRVQDDDNTDSHSRTPSASERGTPREPHSETTTLKQSPSRLNYSSHVSAAANKPHIVATGQHRAGFEDPLLNR